MLLRASETDEQADDLKESALFEPFSYVQERKNLKA